VSAGEGSSPPTFDSGADRTAARALIESELDDLGTRLEQERKSYQRHLLWLILGVSPGALLPMLFVLTEFGGRALVALILTVGGLEGWRALVAKRAIRRMETLEMDLHERLAEVEPPLEQGSDGSRG
jgi:Flp pilus assembly protein TadB